MSTVDRSKVTEFHDWITPDCLPVLPVFLPVSGSHGMTGGRAGRAACVVTLTACRMDISVPTRIPYMMRPTMRPMRTVPGR